MPIPHGFSQLTCILSPFAGSILKVRVPDLFFLTGAYMPESFSFEQVTDWFGPIDDLRLLN